MNKAGFGDRCVWLEQQRLPFAALKLLDIYFNEFPSGGSQIIRECMACGVPAMAMAYSPMHHESVGADIVGPEQAVLENNPERYTEKLISWIRSPEERAVAVKRQKERSQKLYSAEVFVNEIKEYMDHIAANTV
ncbi:MAG: hypothetical protein HRT88_05050 [Lentisphaeraceae bacterium]|nr:hypothetical protein [Lentisphaeraceae bacterium]